MGKKRDEEEEEDDDDIFDTPFNFSDIFNNPEKLFNNPQFKDIFKDIFQKMFENFPSGTFPKEFKNLSLEDIQKQFKNIMKNNPNFGTKGPFMAGWSFNISPDGKPNVVPFGNIQKKPHSKKAEVRDTRDPLVEVAEEEDQIIVIAEIPGVTKEDIELKADIMSLTISTKGGAPGRHYYREVSLPSSINPDHCRARYTNGILEVKLKKAPSGRTDIKVE